MSFDVLNKNIKDQTLSKIITELKENRQGNVVLHKADSPNRGDARISEFQNIHGATSIDP